MNPAYEPTTHARKISGKYLYRCVPSDAFRFRYYKTFVPETLLDVKPHLRGKCADRRPREAELSVLDSDTPCVFNDTEVTLSKSLQRCPEATVPWTSRIENLMFVVGSVRNQV